MFLPSRRPATLFGFVMIGNSKPVSSSFLVESDRVDDDPPMPVRLASNSETLRAELSMPRTAGGSCDSMSLNPLVSMTKPLSRASPSSLPYDWEGSATDSAGLIKTVPILIGVNPPKVADCRPMSAILVAISTKSFSWLVPPPPMRPKRSRTVVFPTRSESPRIGVVNWSMSGCTGRTNSANFWNTGPITLLTA